MIKMYVEYNSPNEIYFHHSVSHSENQQPLQRQPEVHRQCEILYLISGKVQYKIDGETYDIFPGDVILLNICELHSLYIDPNEPYERMVLQFSPKHVPSLAGISVLEPFTNARSFRHVLPRQFVEKSKIPKLLKAVRKDCIKVDALTDLKLVAHIVSIVKEVNEATDMLLKSKESVLPYAASVHKFSKLCTEYINENISKPLKAKDIAKHLHVCESHLHHLFRKEMGISLHSYILNQKMQLAISMLNSGKSPQAVSEELGYEYYSTFFNNFQTFFGYTPNQSEHSQHIHYVRSKKQQGLDENDTQNPRKV